MPLTIAIMMQLSQQVGSIILIWFHTPSHFSSLASTQSSTTQPTCSSQLVWARLRPNTQLSESDPSWFSWPLFLFRLWTGRWWGLLWEEVTRTIILGVEDERSICMVWEGCSSSPSSSPSPSLSRSSSSTFHPSHLCYPVSSWCCRPFETLTFLTNFEVGLKQQGNKYLPPEKCFLSACAPIHSVIIHD